MIQRFAMRVLGLERQELRTVGWSFACFFCVLSSYSMLRPVREMMGVESGATTVPWLFSSTFVVMLLASSAFGWVASRYARRRFLPWVYAFFAANILVFYLAFFYAEATGTEIVWIGRTFFVWISVFNLFVVSVFWSFMADIYSKEQGRRLFGVISAGGSVGGLASLLLINYQFVIAIGFKNLLPLSAILLLLSIVCIHRLRDRLEQEPSEESTESAAATNPLGGSAFAGITHVLSSPYLLAISLLSVIASLLGTSLYMFANELVAESIAGRDERTRFFSIVDASIIVLTLLFQLFAVRHSVRWLGLGVTLALLPLISFLGFGLLAFTPTLVMVAVLQVVRRSIGFGFAKPGNDMLYSVVTPEEKYKAKNFIDTAVYRGGDVIGAWSVRAMWGLGISGIALVMLPFALLWVFIALWLGREYQRRGQSGGRIEEKKPHESNALESA